MKKESFYAWRRALVVYLAGIVCGAALAVCGGILFLRSSMIEEAHSDQSFESVEKSLPDAALKSDGWIVRADSCGPAHLPDGRRMRLYTLCNPKYAAELLEGGSMFSAFLPCRFAVCENPEGTTTIYRLNMCLVGRLAGGVPGRLFSEKILPEQKILFKNAGFTNH